MRTPLEKEIDRKLAAAAKELPAEWPHVVVVLTDEGPYAVSNVPPAMAIEALNVAAAVVAIRGVRWKEPIHDA